MFRVFRASRIEETFEWSIRMRVCTKTQWKKHQEMKLYAINYSEGQSVLGLVPQHNINKWHTIYLWKMVNELYSIYASLTGKIAHQVQPSKYTMAQCTYIKLAWEQTPSQLITYNQHITSDNIHNTTTNDTTHTYTHHHHRLCLQITITPYPTIRTVISNHTCRMSTQQREHSWAHVCCISWMPTLFYFSFARELWAKMVKPNQIKSNWKPQQGNTDVERRPQTKQAGSRASNTQSHGRKASAM